MVMNVVILALWPLLAVSALVSLIREKKNMSPGAIVGWVAVILLIPVVGALSFFVVGKPINKVSLLRR
jgi:hypothetical protein